MSGGVLFLVPGLLCTGDLFAAQRDALAANHEVRIADTLSDVTIDDMADRILAEAPERFSLAGLSMGGYVALAVARKAGSRRLDALALLDTSARPDTQEQTEQRRRLVDLAQRRGILAVAEALCQRVLAPASRSNARITRQIEAMADEVGTERFLIQQEAIIGRIDSRPILAAIDVPTLVVVGEEDVVTAPTLARELCEGIPGSRLDVVHDAGHMTPLEAPEIVAALLCDFFGRPSAVAAG